jgi:hypothetical protein
MQMHGDNTSFVLTNHFMNFKSLWLDSTIYELFKNNEERICNGNVY